MAGRAKGRLREVRVLIYSHDTFGLGHLRRCRTIAHALVENFKGVHVLIISGSQIAGAFDFKARVDFVKIPSVIKLYNGEYTSIGRHIDVQETMKWREAIIRSTAASFEPDIFIADKEPLGLRGELLPTLELLKSSGCALIAGLRDVLDDSTALAAEWARQDVVKRMNALYESVWIYGPQGFWNPLDGIDIPPSLQARLSYTGFLHREVPATSVRRAEPLPPGYILVTTGGGGDGSRLVRAALRAYAENGTLRRPLAVMLGPFMTKAESGEIAAIAERLPHAHLIEFNNRPEELLQNAAGVVAMGGYNTFCEILSFDKPALLVPRTAPRKEQLIRARRAAELGLVDMLLPEEADDPGLMGERLRGLPERRSPHQAGAMAMLNGLDTICGMIQRQFGETERRESFLPPAAE